MTITVQGDDIHDMLRQLDAVRAFRWDILIEFPPLRFGEEQREACIVRVPEKGYQRFDKFVDALAYLKAHFEERRKIMDAADQRDAERTAQVGKVTVR